MTTATGKHGHKDSREPWPHLGDREKAGSQARSSDSETNSSPQRSGDDESLRAREYKDEQGDVHHHTKTYIEQHGKQE